MGAILSKVGLGVAILGFIGIAVAAAVAAYYIKKNDSKLNDADLKKSFYSNIIAIGIAVLMVMLSAVLMYV